MKNTYGWIIALLFILVSSLSVLLFLENQEAKGYQKELQETKVIVEEFQNMIEDIETEYKGLMEKNEKLIKAYEELEEDFVDELEKVIKENLELKQTIESISLNEGDTENNVAVNDSSSLSDSSQGSSGSKTAYLTFDDGPSKNTEKILDLLNEYSIKATFFVNGRNDTYSNNIYKRIIKEGHSIGNHTYSHNYSELYQGVKPFMDSIYKLERHIEKITGVKTKLVRFPGGSNNTVSHKYGGKNLTKEIATRLNKEGYTYFDWNVDSTDASVNKQSEEKIVSSVLNGSKNQKNAIILMHDSSSKTTTVSALPKIIEGLKKEGFSFDQINETTPPPQFLKP